MDRIVPCGLFFLSSRVLIPLNSHINAQTPHLIRLRCEARLGRQLAALLDTGFESELGAVLIHANLSDIQTLVSRLSGIHNHSLLLHACVAADALDLCERLVQSGLCSISEVEPSFGNTVLHIAPTVAAATWISQRCPALVTMTNAARRTPQEEARVRGHSWA